MQKKLEAELMSLAHSILKLKKGDDVVLLKNKAYQVYEKLTVLAYIENYVKETPQNKKTVSELIEETFVTPKETVAEPLLEEVDEKDIKEVEAITESATIQETIVQETVVEEKIVHVETDIHKEPKEDSVVDLFSRVDDIKHSSDDSSKELKNTLEKEFGATVSLDVATDIFENAERINPKKSINESIMQQKNLQIDLNDRIAFVKNLFDGSQEDFNRVISQLNTMDSQKNATTFLKMIKKDYNWDGKEIYEERLLLLIERKFN